MTPDSGPAGGTVDEAAAHLENVLGYRFRDLERLEAALTHTSVAGAGGGGVAEIERLEFLGDAVLGLCITDLLIHQRPEASEGELTRVRARLVNTVALARKAREVGVADLMILGRGEEKSGGRHKASILAGTLEAVLGALFLDGDFAAARQVVEKIFAVDARGVSPAEEDPKTSLQELTQRLFRCLPVYATLSVEGPDHARDFVVEVTVDGRVMGCGSGRSKRLAAQAAARQALEALRLPAEND